MFNFRRAFAALLAAGLLTFSGVGTSFAATHNVARDTLTVKVTKAGATVWGTVTVEYRLNGSMHMVGTCHLATCHFTPRRGVRLHLSEMPTNGATWPFKEWRLNNGGKKTIHQGDKLKLPDQERQGRGSRDLHGQARSRDREPRHGR